MLQAQGPDCVGRKKNEKKEKKKKNLSCSLLILGRLVRCKRSAIITVFGCFNNRPAPLITHRPCCWTASGGPVAVVLSCWRAMWAHHPVSQKSMGANLSFIWLPAQRGRTEANKLKKKRQWIKEKAREETGRISSISSSRERTKNTKEKTPRPFSFCIQHFQ